MKKTMTKTGKKTWSRKFVIGFKKNWQRHLMMLLPLIYIILFEYWPMYGLQIAFRDYTARGGITGSVWVGLEHFREFFANYKWPIYVKNTLRISLYSLIVGFPIPVFLALMLHVNETKWLRKLTQNVSYVPHFISTVVMVGILWQILDPFNGIFATFARLTGWELFQMDLRVNPDAFIHVYVWSGIWQNMGWDTIIYVSALSSVSEELHEAARLDGASRWKRILHVDLPAIMPTVCIMLIMRCGSIMGVGHEKVYLMQNAMNMDVSEVISTYVYKYGLANNQLSYGTAVGLMNSAVNTALLLFVNWITKKLSDDEVGLY